MLSASLKRGMIMLRFKEVEVEVKVEVEVEVEFEVKDEVVKGLRK
jgi:hypothetical protein